MARNDRKRGQGRGGRDGYARRDDPHSRQRNFFYSLIKKEFAIIRGLRDARRFVESMDTFADKAELLGKLEDSRTFGARRVHDIFAFIDSLETIEYLLISFLQKVINDETSRPLTRRLRNRVLMNTYTVPGLLGFLVEIDAVASLQTSSAIVLCSFLVEVSIAFVEPRKSAEVMSLADSLKDRGDVPEVGRLCFVLMVKAASAAQGSNFHAQQKPLNVALMASDLRPPGDRHDNDALNYRNIRLVPTLDEIRCETPAYLPLSSGANKIIEDPCQRLLDSSFRLLREDAVQTMKTSIADQKRPWKNARIVDLHCKGNARSKDAMNSLSFVIQCSGKGKIDWERSRSLSHRSVVALCRDGVPIRMGMISIRNPQAKGEWLHASGGPRIGVAIESENEFGDSLREMDINAARNGELCELVERHRRQDGATVVLRQKIDRILSEMVTYDLVEVSQSFSTYQPILQTLQTMDLVPLEDELVHCRSTKPDYMPNEFTLPNDKYFKGLNCNLAHFDSKVVTESTSVDLSQAEALKHTFSSRVALLQGPPGTGKTFIGGIIARTIRENTDETILCVCYTNHALDQFLEHMLAAGEQKIVRIGGRSKSEAVAPYNLRELARRHGKDQTDSRLLRQIDGKLHSQHDRMHLLVEKLKTQVTWTSPNGGVRELLNVEEQEISQYLQVPNVTDSEGFTLVGPNNQEIRDDELFKCWKNGQGFPRWLIPFVPDSDTVRFHEFWNQSRSSRLALLEGWRQLILETDVNELFSLIGRFNDMMEEKQAIRRALDNKILRTARVIGVTTTGAALYREVLNEKAAGVVIVEEAGEVLEAHVLSSLNAATKHLILIGDHKQLRPKVETYRLTDVAKKGYNLDQSLFERLVLSELPSVSLLVQHRMRPEISAFIRSQTYPRLLDHQSVLHHPNVKGVASNVVFINHDVPEDGASQDEDTLKTKSNTYEAEVCLEIVRYLLLQGYQPSDIVVLTPYVGQLVLISRLMKIHLREVTAYVSESDQAEIENAFVDTAESPVEVNPVIGRRSVRCSSIDNFQGEEATVVVGSLVRSNPRGIVGFMKEPQRVNVLLSRARHGMFLVGNPDTLTAKSGKAVWGPLLERMRVLDGLPTTCQLHPADDPIILKNQQDFRRCRPNGGCDRACQFRMRCGHACPKMCHPIDKSHLVAEKECCQPCRRFPPECSLNHSCPKLCSQDCGQCSFLVGPTTLGCGHVVPLAKCHDVRSAQSIDKLSQRCKELVQHTFSPCGHTCQTGCSNAKSDSPECPLECHTILVCGHPCKNRCGKCDGKHNCGVFCDRQLFCGHVCGQPCHPGQGCKPCDRKCHRACVHSCCPNACSLPCSPCVESCDWKCDHQMGCPLVCAAPCSRLPCNKRCEKLLKCSHQCPSVCGEECPDSAFCQECGDKKSQVVDVISFSPFGDVDLSEDPIIVLPCRHFYTISTLDGHFGIRSVYESDASGDFIGLRDLYAADINEKPKWCPDCREPIRSVRRYGRIINFSELRALERKHMASINRSFQLIKTSTDKYKIDRLKKLEKELKSGPMKSVWEASQAKADVVTKPPTSQYLHVIELLATEYSKRTKAFDNPNYNLAALEYKRGIDIAFETSSHTTNGHLRIGMAALVMNWMPAGPPKTERIQEILHWVLEEKHLGVNMVDKAEKILQMLDDAEISEVVAAMNVVDGYDYGGTWSSHWYECPNGHPYFIGECGGAMQTSRCIECGETVGGTGHSLHRTNRGVGGLVGNVLSRDS